MIFQNRSVQRDMLCSLLPRQKPRTSRPPCGHRTVLDGIPWGLRLGRRWRALTARSGSWKTGSGRFS